MYERTNIRLSAAERNELEAVVANRNSPQKHVWRAKIVLLTADAHGTAEIMRATGKAKTVIWRWQERFQDEGAAGLWRDKTRPSRIPPLGPEVAERVVALTLAGPPPTASHWTGSAMAKAAGISVSSVQRIWRAHGLRPHLVRRFKLSNDPQFAAKLREIVGLYVNPPDHAIVLSVDEKSQIQALDRTQPGLPMKKGRAGTITHDYKRILLGSLVQVKGFGFALVWSRKRWMASLSSWRERNTPRLRRFLVSLAKKLSTALSQEVDVGVKWNTNRGWFSIHSRTLGCL